MSKGLSNNELIDIISDFSKVATILGNAEYKSLSNDYLLKQGLEYLSFEEQEQLLEDFIKALSELKKVSAIGTENRSLYRELDMNAERLKMQLLDQTIDKIYEPLEELGIKRNDSKSTGFSISALRQKQKEIDKK